MGFVYPQYVSRHITRRFYFRNLFKKEEDFIIMSTKLKIGLGMLAIIAVVILIWFNFIGLPKDTIPLLRNGTLSSTDNLTKVTQPISKNDSIDIGKSSETQLDVGTISNFSEVVNKLDTPEKLLAYMKENFKFKSHDGHISYPPEEFFRKKEGDCKDLATFGSYVLKQHGYDVKIMCLKFSGELKGQHAITLFYDKDRKLKYITNNAKNLELIEVESLDEILAQENKRLDCKITKYGFVSAGNTYIWVDNL